MMTLMMGFFIAILFSCCSSSNLRQSASPVNVPGISNLREVVTTKCQPPNDCSTTSEIGDIIQTIGTTLPLSVVHTTSTDCQSDDCSTSTVTNPPPPLTKDALKARVAELERLVDEKEAHDRANATLASVSNLATKAIKEYHATLLRSAAQAIKERTSPEQLLLYNISTLLTRLTVNKTTLTLKVTAPICCEKEIAECMACQEKMDVKIFCESHQKVEGCGGPIDLAKLNLPDVEVEEDAPPTLEERVSDMEQWLTRKLHKRMDNIDEKRLKNSHVKLTSEEMKKKIVQLSADIQTELVKKMDKMEQARRKELMKKVQKLQETIENGGKEVDDDENENDKTQEHPAEGSKETEGTALSSAPPAPQSKDEEEVLDANNSEEVYKLTGGEGEEDDDEKDDDEKGDCDDGSSGDPSFLELPPCPVYGENGLNNLLNPSLYEGGEPDVAPRHKNTFHKVTEVEPGSMDAAEIITTDLDDPPPKTMALNGVPLNQIIVGSNAPKDQEVNAGLAEVGLTN